MSTLIFVFHLNDKIRKEKLEGSKYNLICILTTQLNLREHIFDDRCSISEIACRPISFELPQGIYYLIKHSDRR